MIDSAEMYGWQTLSDLDLFTIVTGNREGAEAMMRYFEQSWCSVDGLMNLNIGGMGRSTAMKIKAMHTLFTRSREVRIEQVRQSTEVYNYIKPNLQNLLHEEFWIILLDGKNHPVRKFCHTRGGSSFTAVDLRLIMKEALESRKCRSIAVAHNHPGGICKPSTEDKNVTKRLMEACALLDFGFVDHVIVTDNGYYSFKDNDMLENIKSKCDSICKL